jgi:hypothetical protein
MAIEQCRSAAPVTCCTVKPAEHDETGNLRRKPALPRARPAHRCRFERQAALPDYFTMYQLLPGPVSLLHHNKA